MRGRLASDETALIFTVRSQPRIGGGVAGVGRCLVCVAHQTEEEGAGAGGAAVRPPQRPRCQDFPSTATAGA